MEEKINVVEILKDKPVNTKLWSPLFGDVYTSSICSEDTIIIVNHHAESSSFYNNGKYFNHAEAEPLLFPSKEMRDWKKFSWKKGDVLISDCGFVCIFKELASDDYTKFNGCYFDGMPNAETAKYSKLDNNTAYGYIREIENRCGGKLNLETLKIEKQSEFKDGDIVVYGKSVAICRKIYKHTLCFYVSLNEMFGLLFDDEVESSEEYRFATEEEKQQLFDALEKEGMAWDAEKKMIVDLKPKVEFKPFDKVLCRNSKDDTWEADFFARLTRKGIDYTQSDKYLCVGDLWMYCIPYNEEIAHLLGTTDEWKGGKE